MAEKHLLILGAGSVGRRHAQNFAGLGCTLSAMDPRADRLTEAANATPWRHTFARLEEALAAPTQYAGVVISSPPRFHVEQAIAALEVGLPVFLEKPVSPDAVSAKRLVEASRRAKAPLLLGYTYRWWPPIQELKRRIVQGVVGKILHVRCVMSAHLADWHPWERYQDFFMASTELGGGALLDESHFLDLMLWFFGVPEQLFAKVERLSALQIDTDDTVDAWLMYPSGMRIAIHLDLYGRPHEKFITVTGERGTLQWSFEPNRVRYSRTAEQAWEETSYTSERNEMFVNAAKEFLAVLDGRQQPSCTIEDGYTALRVIEAMRQSSLTNQATAIA